MDATAKATSTRDAIVTRVDALGQETLNRCIKKQSVNFQLQPEYLHWLLPLLQTQVNLFSAITTLLAVDRLTEAAPLVRILMEAYTNLHFVLGHKKPEEVWALYFSEFVMDTAAEARHVGKLNDKSYDEVCDADPHYKLWRDMQKDPRVAALLNAKQTKDALNGPLGQMMDTIRQLAAGTGPLTTRETEVARHLAKRHLADKEYKKLEWKSIPAEVKEEANVQEWIDPGDSPDVTAKKQLTRRFQFNAMRFEYNAHVHCSGTLLSTMLNGHPTSNAVIEIGPSRDTNLNLITWKLAGEFAVGSIHKMVSHFDLGSDLMDDVTAVHAGFKTHFD